MTNREMEIIMLLLQNQQIIAEDLGKQLGVSTRTLRNDILHINQEISSCATIFCERGSGYSININDEDLFLSFMKKESHEELSGEERIDYIIIELLSSDDGVKMEDLAESLYISRSQLKNDMVEVRGKLANYDLEVKHSPYQGLYVEGDEYNKRLVLTHHAHKRYEMLETQVSKVVSSCLQNYEYSISDENFENLVHHLCVMVKRIEKGYPITLEKETKISLMKEKEYELANDIMVVLSQIFNLSFSEDECAYITIHLACKELCHETGHTIITEDIIDLVHSMLKRVEEETGYDFYNDFNLLLSLQLHSIPIIKRIIYHTYIHNPLLSEIKQKLTLAYDLAVSATKVINEKYNVIIPEDEIGYYAIHFSVALQRTTSMIHKKRILIVCSSGKAGSQLLRLKFEEQFSNYIEHMDVSAVMDIHDYDINSYDCIFTTIPLALDTSTPIVHIQHFLDSHDLHIIKNNLITRQSASLTKYFPKELFRTNMEYDSYEEAIREICSNIRKYYELPDQFEEDVLERERIASTEFNEYFAFPHPSSSRTNETFVAITMLKRPLLWQKYKVRGIFLISVEKDKMKNVGDLYQLIIKIMSNATYFKPLLERCNYETFVTMLEEKINE